MGGVHRMCPRARAKEVEATHSRWPNRVKGQVDLFCHNPQVPGTLMLCIFFILAPMACAGPSKAPPPPKPRLGRPGTNLKAGLVGLPNVGKSSLFNVLCSMSVPAENYPFCTIDPAQSRVLVPDERFEWLCELFKPNSRVPAHLQITDIAGLVKGAAEGRGLGNAFLSHIQGVDCIVHVVRLFDGDDIAHVEDSVDPVRDLEIIAGELRQKDLDAVQRRLDAIGKSAGKRKPGSVEEREAKALEKTLALLQEGKDIVTQEWSAQEIEVLNAMQLLTAKERFYVLNLSESDFRRKKNKWLAKVKAWIDAHGGGATLPLSCALEARLAAGEEEGEGDGGGVKSGLGRLIRAAYEALGMESFFTVGSDEVRAWSVRRGSRAPEAAGAIHSDMQRGFIMAETMAYGDLKEAGSVAAVKSAGKYKMNGREYVVQDGDIFHFKFNVAPAHKKK